MIEQTRLEAIRKYYKITQKQMAELINVNVRTYINKEKGTTQFTMNEMFIISNKLNMPIEEIFLPNNFTLHEVKEERCSYELSKKL